MQVQTYEVEEVAGEHPECADEAVALIESLGLEGQRNLLSKAADGKTNRCPYRKMTKDEATVFGLLCPKSTPIHKFADELIPLRVLQIYQHAKSLEIFSDFKVMHPESADIEDPILIAIREDRVPNQYVTGGFATTTETYILARWGAVLEEWPALLKMAASAWVSAVKAQISDWRGKASNWESKLTTQPTLKMMEKVPSYWD